VSELIIYGGQPTIIATRLEIERVQSSIASALDLLESQLLPLDILNHPLKRVALAIEIPPVTERLRFLITACEHAASEYFGGEIQVASGIEKVGVGIALNSPSPLFATAALATSALFGLSANPEVQAISQGRQILVDAPTNLEAIRSRLENTAVDKSTVRIERYEGNKFLVYIPGTQNWSLIPGENPLDLRSNLYAMAAPELAASERAVQSALISAGVAAGAKVVLVGHSQGGIIAANIASRKQPFTVAGVLTFGAPVSQQAAHLRVPTLSIEHTNDSVPKLDLKQNPDASNWVTVQSEALIDPASSDSPLVQAHELEGYQDLTEAADKNPNSGLQRLRDIITNFATGKGKAETFLLRAT
jgi:predicted alpha/beta hydrolase family esterase